MLYTMDDPSNRPQYQQNIPYSIQEKLSLLSVFENLIANLETQLQSMKTELQKLQADVEPYRVQDKPDHLSVTTRHIPRASKPPISRCPNEILYLIFQQYLVGRHRAIGKLLFVCKHWNSVVMNSPGLWARIEVKDATEFFRPSKQSPAISYISSCYVRSRDILLDVDLSMGVFPHHSGYIACQLEERASQIVKEDEEEDFMAQISDIEWEYTPLGYDCVFEKFTECLFGTNGSHIVRWASLFLFLPFKAEAAISIWKKISCPFPNLKKLSIHHISSDVLPPTHFSSLKIPSVERLIVGLGPQPAPLDVFQISWNLLTHLELAFDERLENIQPISSLTSLQTLELSSMGTGYYEDAWMPPDPSTWPIYSISLPRLTELLLYAEYEPLRAIQFDLPLLDKLTVRSRGKFNKLPVLSPRRILWQINSWWEDKWEPKGIYTALNSFVTLSPSSITIPQFARTTGLPATAVISQNQTASIPAVQVYVEHNEGHIEQLSREETKILLSLAKMC